MLVEVTSSGKLADCKLVLDALLSEMVALQGGQLKVVQGRVVVFRFTIFTQSHRHDHIHHSPFIV